MSSKQGEGCRIGVMEGVCKGDCMGDEPLTLMYEDLGWKSCLWLSLKLKGHKGKNFFLFFSILSFPSLQLSLIS